MYIYVIDYISKKTKRYADTSAISFATRNAAVAYDQKAPRPHFDTTYRLVEVVSLEDVQRRHFM